MVAAWPKANARLRNRQVEDQFKQLQAVIAAIRNIRAELNVPTDSRPAVRLLTKQAAVEYAPEGIRVNSIHPGYIDTAMLRAPFEGRPGELEKIIAAVTPMGRVGTPEEIANAALFLAGGESSFMTGAEMVVDGGYTAR